MMMGMDWWSTKLLHGSLKVLDIGGWVGIGGRRMEELTGQAESGAIHKLCSCAVDVFLESGADAKMNYGERVHPVGRIGLRFE